MSKKLFWRSRALRFVSAFAHLFLLAASFSPAFAQDIVLSDFEQTNYAWLPGGSWVNTGSAFGSSPAHGALSGQNALAGYQGNGFVDSFFGGDVSTGILTSPVFTVQRKYIKFLIGGGNWRRQTCMNLLVGGQVVRSAVGMGDREDLGWLQWNVSSFSNQTAQIQIVDSATGGWGHLNVDQITESDTPLPFIITASQHYLNLPIRTGAAKHLVELVQDGLVVREMNVELADTATNFYAFMDLTPLQGKELLVRVDSQLASSNQLAAYFIQSNSIIAATPIYQESLRPIYHYTARRGWINDPNGMVYFNGEYHLCYQHNPFGWLWDNMHWGNAVSTDLVHWQELPEAIYPDYLGAAWSGSSVVDSNNTSGFGTNAIVSFYTEAAGHGNNPRMSAPYLFTQGIAYSLDSDRTFTTYTNNPIIPNVKGDNRDPKVIWYPPASKWVMVFWLTNNDFGFFSSTDLKHWTQNSTFTFPNIIEVPELFTLPLDGNTNNSKWIFYAGAGHYYVGLFDGNTFSAQNGPYSIRGGNSFAAGQTFNNMPAADARRILIANGTQTYPGMPFNEAMDFPVELTLNTVAGSPTMFVNPVSELSALRISTNTWSSQSLPSGVNILSGTTGEAFDLDATFQPGGAATVTFNLIGNNVTYNRLTQTVSCAGVSQSLAPIGGSVRLQVLVDRGIIEIFGNNGLLYMPMTVTPVSGQQPVSLMASGSGATLNSLVMHKLGSAWNYTNSGVTNPPLIISQPAAATNFPGFPAVLSVSATGASAYQWYFNGQPLRTATNIGSVTNSSLLISPSTVANIGSYYVVITNSAGSVTSSVVTLTFTPAYPVAYWRMEAQIVTPNLSGVPTFNGVADSATNNGQGIYTTGTLLAAIDDLITFNGLSGNPVTLSTNVPPPSMFVNGHNGGNFSYNAEIITNVDGALFFPQDQYGDEMDFIGPFTIELFFKTDGNRGGAGMLQLISQGTDTGQIFRYGITFNESAAGGLRFKVANASLAQTNAVDLTGSNYADGNWHYLQAVCDSAGGAGGQLRLTIVNQDSSQASATNNLPAGFLPLPAGNNGNLFLGRNTYPMNVNPATFLGFIDEVQITSGVVPDNGRIGRVPSIDNHLQIKGVGVGANGVSFFWNGAAANSFSVQWVAHLGDIWQTLSTTASAGNTPSYIDTNTARLSSSTGFYRILSR